MSFRPASIGGLNNQGRPLAAGEPANLVLLDPAAVRVVDPVDTASASRNTPFAGHKLPGRVVATYLRGKVTVRDGQVQEVAG
jgi:dihydroorotase